MTDIKIKVVTAMIMYNEKGEIFLVRSYKWGGAWSLPGGGLESSELLKDCMRREIKEELSLDLDNIEFLDWGEQVSLPEYKEKSHFIYFLYTAQISSDATIILNEELQEYKWFRPEEIERIELPELTRRNIKKGLQKIQAK